MGQRQDKPLDSGAENGSTSPREVEPEKGSSNPPDEKQEEKGSSTPKQEALVDDSAHSALSKEKEDLWKDALEKKLDDGTIVQLSGMEDNEKHTVFARVVVDDSTNSSVSVGKVVECMVDEGWKHVIKDVLERKEHVEVDSHPPASHLLQLGAVWLLNETAYLQHKGAHAHRLAPKDEDRVPDWKDFTLRVHHVPDRFFVAHEYDWTKHCCKGLLVDKTVEAKIGDETPHVPVFEEGLPDGKEGVIVYENEDLGYAVIIKPGSMPVHATLSNHSEDAVSMFRKIVEERRRSSKNDHHQKLFVSVPQRHSLSLDTRTDGLLAISTSHPFANYFMHLLDAAKQRNPPLKKKFKCLVCVKDPDSMGKLEHFQKSKTLVTHYVNSKSPVPKRFVRHKPHKMKNKSDWQECKLRILQVGDDKFRAASVKSASKISAEVTLSHYLWGPTPPESIEYVMEVQLEIASHARTTHQIRGQLAALGFPIVGDVEYGGGKCEVHSHKHFWYRMALQCCDLSFPEPKWKDDSKKELVASERRCVFRLHKAWWSDYLQQYEMHRQSPVG